MENYLFPEKIKLTEQEKAVEEIDNMGQEQLEKYDYIIHEIRDEISMGQKGYRTPKFIFKPATSRSEESDEWTGYPSTFPCYFRNKKYTKSGCLRIIDKYMNRKKLTGKQLSILKDLLAGEIEKYPEGFCPYDLSLTNSDTTSETSEEHIKSLESLNWETFLSNLDRNLNKFVSEYKNNLDIKKVGDSLSTTEQSTDILNSFFHNKVPIGNFCKFIEWGDNLFIDRDIDEYFESLNLKLEIEIEQGYEIFIQNKFILRKGNLCKENEYSKISEKRVSCKISSGLTEESIAEFKEIYKTKYKQELSNEEAFLRGSNLLNLYKAVYGSITICKKDNL